MDETVRQALADDTLIDITTTGRKTGKRHRIEIQFHYVDRRIFISGNPGPRGWYANLVANPQFTWHFTQSLERDIAAEARAITDEADRRAIFERIPQVEDYMGHVVVDDWTKRSPLVEVRLST